MREGEKQNDKFFIIEGVNKLVCIQYSHVQGLSCKRPQVRTTIIQL